MTFHSPSNTRLIVGNYIADVLIGKGQSTETYYYIIQRIGSAEVLDLAYFHTFEAAKESAQAALYDLAKNDLRMKGESAAG